MAKLTKKERQWLEELQEVLDRCPSARLGFYTTGDPDIAVYDANKEDAINDSIDRNGWDFCSAVAKHSAGLRTIRFPAPVHSTAG